jgi:hypothetical protein
MAMIAKHTWHIRISVTALFALAFLRASRAVAEPVSLYISTQGNDAWSGKLASPNEGRTDGPFATLGAARQTIRQMKATGLPTGGVTVWIHPGDYYLEQGFELTAEDTGTAESPIVYRAAGTQATRLIGGREISNWRKVEDPAILDRLDPAAKSNVVQADLKALGIANFGRLSSRGFGRAVTPAGLELFFAGKPMTLARWPNGDFTKIVGYPDGVGDEHGGKLGKLTGGFNYKGDRPSRWHDTSDIWIHGYWAYDWANSYEHIASIDLDKRLIKTSPPYGHYGFRAGGDGGRFFFLNVLEELDEPGEWYLDRTSGILYFWPPQPINQDRAMVSIVENPVIHINGASYVTVQGLTVACARGTGVRIAGGDKNRVVDCTLGNLGNYGIVIDGGMNHAVDGCTIYETGDGGISLSGGDRRTLAAAGHAAENNHIHHIARWSRCYAPAILISGVGIRASNNLIHDHPHCAILFSGNEHTIERNEIHHVCLETGDVGAIYTGRDYTYRGNVIRHNFIHHTGGVGMGSMGIYMDDCVSGTLIYGNVLWKLHRAVFLGGGRDFRVENNIFVDCDPAVELDGRGLSTAPVWHDMVYKTMKQRLEEMNWTQPPYRTRYPELAALERYYARDDGVPPGNVLVARNICAGSKLLNVTWGAKPEMAESRDNLTDADPLFVDAAKGNFRLKADSPAFKLGFEPIPFDKIGPRPQAIRTE